MSSYDFEIPVTFRHRIRFTTDAFAPENPVVADLLAGDRPVKVLVYVESEIVRLYPELRGQIAAYLAPLEMVTLTEIVEMPGGEACKISKTQIMEGIKPIERNGIDRHSFVFCIGGGAFLDVIAESFNNPIRLWLGWYALVPDSMLTPPPLSIMLAWWCFGGLLMTGKRYSEFRFIDNKELSG